MRKLRELERIRPAANTFLLPSPRRSAPTLTPAMWRRGERGKPLKRVAGSRAVRGDEAKRGAPQHACRAAQPLRCMLGARLDPRVATLLTSRLLSVGPMDHLPGVTAFLGGEEEEEVVTPWEVCYPELGPAIHPFRHSPPLPCVWRCRRWPRWTLETPGLGS